MTPELKPVVNDRLYNLKHLSLQNTYKLLLLIILYSQFTYKNTFFKKYVELCTVKFLLPCPMVLAIRFIQLM